MRTDIVFRSNQFNHFFFTSASASTAAHNSGSKLQLLNHIHTYIEIQFSKVFLYYFSQLNPDISHPVKHGHPRLHGIFKTRGSCQTSYVPLVHTLADFENTSSANTIIFGVANERNCNFSNFNAFASENFPPPPRRRK